MRATPSPAVAPQTDPSVPPRNGSIRGLFVREPRARRLAAAGSRRHRARARDRDAFGAPVHALDRRNDAPRRLSDRRRALRRRDARERRQRGSGNRRPRKFRRGGCRARIVHLVANVVLPSERSRRTDERRAFRRAHEDERCVRAAHASQRSGHAVQRAAVRGVQREAFGAAALRPLAVHDRRPGRQRAVHADARLPRRSCSAFAAPASPKPPTRCRASERSSTRAGWSRCSTRTSSKARRANAIRPAGKRSTRR